MKIDSKGLLIGAHYFPTPNFNERPEQGIIDLLVIHNISLPPGQYTGNFVQSFFLNQLNPQDHPYFKTIMDLKVSAHLFIRRNAQVLQFVPFSKRAWHAGTSHFQNRKDCNNFSIGIELEGTDSEPFTPKQYNKLAFITHLLMQTYPITIPNIVGHSDIAPGRKTDPGPAFDWPHYKKLINQLLHNS